jgi:hypothetical protein
MKVINTVTKRTMEAGPDGCITFRDQVVRHPAVRVLAAHAFKSLTPSRGPGERT